MATIQKSSLKFLTDLSKNNNRDWFNDNKSRYVETHENVIAFADALLAEMQKHDVLDNENGKKSLYRIYRDTRFSKNKDPYKNNLGGSFRRSGANRRGGYYFHIQPGAGFVGGGFWGPNSDDLKHLRAQIAADAEPLRKVIADPKFKKYFGELRGDQVKTAPQGYTKDHPNIDLLRHKQFLVSREFSDQEMLADNFKDEVAATFVAMLPFFDVMTEYLTTDLNGVSTI